MTDRPSVALVTAQLATLWEDPPRAGGAEVQVALLARALQPFADVTAVAFEPERGAGVRIPPDLRVELVPRSQAATALMRAYQDARSLRRALERLAPGVCVQRCLGLDTWAVARFAKASGTPFVYHWASDSDQVGPSDRPSPLWRLYAAARRRADLQVCQTARQARLAGPSAIVIPDLVDRTLAWRRADGDEVLWVGRLAPAAKRPDLAVEVARALPHRRFRMVGPLSGDDAFQQRMRGLIDGTPNLTWEGPLPRARMPEAYARARVLLNTSDYEGFPNTFTEAWACGVPVASLNVDPDGDLASSGAGTCAQGDLRRLATAVEAEFLRPRSEGQRAAIGRRLARHEPAAVAQAWMSALAQARKARP